jgi:hypothetical protein
MERAMQQYQSGARKNALMQSMLQGLSVDELKDIAAYLALLLFLPLFFSCFFELLGLFCYSLKQTDKKYLPV